MQNATKKSWIESRQQNKELLLQKAVKKTEGVCCRRDDEGEEIAGLVTEVALSASRRNNSVVDSSATCHIMKNFLIKSLVYKRHEK